MDSGGDATGRQPDRDYRPGLDGLRALAIASVLAFHLGHLAGGNLGVDAFFVLSGWLITWKLLHDLTAPNGRVGPRLRGFWAARGRRLLPASLTVIAAVAVVWPLAGITVRSLRRDVVFATFWSSNWGTITAHGDYWARFGEPSPLTHFWSLAVEEQYYLVWPLLVAAAVLIGRRHARRLVGALAAALTASSIVTMVLIFHASNPTATYLNTFARAHSLLIGALAATITTARADGGLTGGRLARRLAPLAAAAAVAIVATSDERSTWLFRWGFPAFAVAMAVVVVAVADGWCVRVLAAPPMRWLADRSYGLYLWHWPVIVLMSPARTHLGGIGLDAARVAVSVALADVSFRALETPIRRRRRLPARRAPIAAAFAFATVTVLAVVVVPGAPTTSAASVVTLPPAPTAASLAAAPPAASASTVAVDPVGPARFAGEAPATSTLVAPTGPGATSVAPRAAAATRPVRVLVVGDSTGEQLAETLGQAAVAHPAELQVGSAAFPGCGMTAAHDGRLHVFTNTDAKRETIDLSGCVTQWQTVRDRAAGSEHPDVVLVSIGPWDAVDIRLSDGRTVSVGDPAGRQLVIDAYTAFVHDVEGAGVAVAWVTPADTHLGWGSFVDPVNDPARWTAVRDILGTLPVHHIDLAGWLTANGLDGRDARPDGVHLTPEVRQRFVDEVVLPAIASIGPRAG